MPRPKARCARGSDTGLKCSPEQIPNPGESHEIRFVRSFPRCDRAGTSTRSSSGKSARFGCTSRSFGPIERALFRRQRCAVPLARTLLAQNPERFGAVDAVDATVASHFKTLATSNVFDMSAFECRFQDSGRLPSTREKSEPLESRALAFAPFQDSPALTHCRTTTTTVVSAAVGGRRIETVSQ